MIYEEFNGTDYSTGTNLKKLRKKNNLTQRQLAILSGLSLSTISKYEQESRLLEKASFEHVNMLAKALHCTPAELLRKKIKRKVFNKRFSCGNSFKTI